MMPNLSGLFQAATQLMQNPMQLLRQRGLNVPQGMMNNPNAIIQHLMNSGQITQQQYQQARQMAEQFRMR